jgi:hypothetical protein
MGLWKTFKKAVGASPTHETFAPRIPARVCRYVAQNKVQILPASEYLANRAERALAAARQSLQDDKERGHTFAERLSGAQNIPHYWHLAYSAGYPLDRLAALIDEYLEQLSYYDSVFTKIWTMEHNRISDVGSFYTDALFGLGWLVGLRASRSQIERFLSFCGQPGQDALFDRLVVALGFDRPIAPSLRFPQGYGDTLAVLDSHAEHRAELMKKVFPRWFRTRFPDLKMKGPDDLEYIGYWAVDLALIVIAFDIRDAVLRDEVLYPRDLVDYQRSPAVR